ncbi:MAG: class I SAM-dependent methyltransferase [Desulfomonilaceae bacterium]|jgi:2-polyprenyl-3-methyl-5-hydroxy-6-metoxy-1,4-benzoquinol methylase
MTRAFNELIKMEYTPCDLCGSMNHEIIYSKIDHVTGLEFHVVECECGMVFVNPMPSEECTRLLYPSDYLTEKPFLGSLFREMIRLLPPMQEGSRRLLDVGCGTGHFIKFASQVGWDAEGVDFADWGSSKNDVKIRLGNFPSMDYPGESYNVITSWAVLEHVRYPSLFFQKIGKLLDKDGAFIFTVPNVSAPGMKLSCDEDVPRHLWLFTPSTTKDYLLKYGMRVETILHNGKVYRSYPFGLLRYGWHVLFEKKDPVCSVYQNKSVALLRNRSVSVHYGDWVRDVLRTVSPLDIVVDGLDLGLGLMLANLSKWTKNYGVITVIARKQE